MQCQQKNPSTKSREAVMNNENTLREIWCELQKYGDLSNTIDVSLEPFSCGLLDSISVLKFIVFMQKSYPVSIQPTDIIDGKVKTVGDLVNFVHS